VNGDLRDRIDAVTKQHTPFADKPGVVSCGMSWLQWHDHLTDVLLPLFAEVEANARAEVRERVEAELSNAEDGKGLVDEAGDWWVEVAVIRAALGDTTPTEVTDA
jgi:hypothetical protein